MQGVAVEEHRVAGFEFAGHDFEPGKNVLHAGGVGDVLAFARNRHVVDAPEQMRSGHHVEAAVD